MKTLNFEQMEQVQAQGWLSGLADGFCALVGITDIGIGARALAGVAVRLIPGVGTALLVASIGCGVYSFMR